jgi:hypothetical protein
MEPGAPIQEQAIIQSPPARSLNQAIDSIFVAARNRYYTRRWLFKASPLEMAFLKAYNIVRATIEVKTMHQVTFKEFKAMENHHCLSTVSLQAPETPNCAP